MKFKMYFTRKNKKLDIDNEKLGYMRIITKLEEEYKEVVQAIIKYSVDRTLLNLIEIVRETLDLIQICILILWRCRRLSQYFDYEDMMKNVFEDHNDKLRNRGWELTDEIEIRVKS